MSDGITFIIFPFIAIPLLIWAVAGYLRRSEQLDRERRDHRRWGGIAPKK